MSTPQEQLLGWRAWRLRGGRLASWATSYVWYPSGNVARCLDPNNPCVAVPGGGCRCGFWALFNPRHCISRVCEDHGERSPVLGLVRAWGEVALHGEEGFRAQYAAPVCLFTDWLWDTRLEPAGRLAQLWQGCKRFVAGDRDVVDPVPDLEGEIRHAADDYGIPALSLADACRAGVLEEMGVDARLVPQRY